MKLPGSTLMPCRNQIAPKSTRAVPTMFRVIRILLFILSWRAAPKPYAHHIERDGVGFFRLTCERDLEGLVSKLKHGRYGEGWFKIRNPDYSQREGRRELFEKRINNNVGRSGSSAQGYH